MDAYTEAREWFGQDEANYIRDCADGTGGVESIEELYSIDGVEKIEVVALGGNEATILWVHLPHSPNDYVRALIRIGHLFDVASSGIVSPGVVQITVGSDKHGRS